jgi:hypothetical protein
MAAEEGGKTIILKPESNTGRFFVVNQWDFAFTESKSEFQGLIYSS